MKFMVSRSDEPAPPSRNKRQLRPLRTFPTGFLDCGGDSNENNAEAVGQRHGLAGSSRGSFPHSNGGLTSQMKTKQASASAKKRKSTSESCTRATLAERHKAAQLRVTTSDGTVVSGGREVSEMAKMIQLSLGEEVDSACSESGQTRSDDIVTSSDPSNEQHSGDSSSSQKPFRSEATQPTASKIQSCEQYNHQTTPVIQKNKAWQTNSGTRDA